MAPTGFVHSATHPGSLAALAQCPLGGLTSLKRKRIIKITTAEAAWAPHFVHELERFA
jgi:hypothetical protein